MPIALAFIRGINVGGKNLLPMAELRALCEKLGFKDVKTYIQSGNVVFQTAAVNKAASSLAAAIERSRGFRPSIVVRTMEQVQAALEANPFAKVRDLNKSRCLIMFLEGKPLATAAKALRAMDTGNERARHVGTEAYLYLPDGVADAQISMSTVEKVLGVPGTCRNLNTIERLHAMAKELDAN